MCSTQPNAPAVKAPGENRGLVGTIQHVGRRLGGEAYFVPKPAPGSGSAAGNGTAASHRASRVGQAEDDGYLMTFVVDEGSGASELVVYDSASMSDVPVVRLAAPQRIPLGFHSTWVTGAELQAQGRAEEAVHA